LIDHLHYEFRVSLKNIVEVNMDSEANVLLMDDANYSKYCKGHRFSYFGGFVTGTPYQIRPPKSGRWHVVIDRGGHPGQVRAAVRILE
jgi:hypothetical protein